MQQDFDLQQYERTQMTQFNRALKFADEVDEIYMKLIRARDRLQGKVDVFEPPGRRGYANITEVHDHVKARVLQVQDLAIEVAHLEECAKSKTFNNNELLGEITTLVGSIRPSLKHV